jgi:hypothetical protein
MSEHGTIEDQIADLRTWLRMHGDYDVRLNLWDVYGTYRISIWRHATELASDIGENLDKRLAWAMDRLGEMEIERASRTA